MKKQLMNNSFIVLGGDALLVAAAWWSAYMLRFNFQIPTDSSELFIRMLPLIVMIKIVIFYFFNLYKGMWRYTSIGDLFNIIKSATISSLFILCLTFFVHGETVFSFSFFIIDAILVLLYLSGFRLGIRLIFLLLDSKPTSLKEIRKKLFVSNGQKTEDMKNLLIIGAGDCGEKIFREIRDNPRLKYHVVGFVDDDVSKVGRRIHGVPIVGEIHDIHLLIKNMKIDECLIAIPSATSEQMRRIVKVCKDSGLPSKIIPGMGELINGKVSAKAIRDVAYRDLIGREIIRLESKLIGRYLENSRVMVTGAGGSIGSELCRQICRFKPSRLILFERAESPLYDMEMELKKFFGEIEIVPLLADICEPHHLTNAFEAFHPQVVFHAAAYKHVPMLERYPWQAVNNNVIGTRNLIDMCNKNEVERFVFVSTDKAVRPTNIMGTSKRIAELLIQGQNACQLSKTQYITVRFGNVVGSAGSVIPLFKKQIENGGPVTVTHPDVTRYFMTIPEACQLILQAGSMGEGGEIFILDMGRPIKIIDMARDLIRFSGLEPDKDINIEIVGLRPGEKLHEELIIDGEGVVPTSHEKIMVLRPQVCDQIRLNGNIDKLGNLALRQDKDAIRKMLKTIVPEYKYQDATP